MKNFELTSWNVKGLNHPLKRMKVLSHLKHLKTEIIFLQETHIRCSDNEHFLSRWSGQRFHSSFPAKARGVSILLGRHIEFEPHNIVLDRLGRFVIVPGRLFNTMVVFVNVYAPYVDDVAFFGHLFSLLPDLTTYHLIMGGNFNCCLNPVFDRSSTNPLAISKSASFIQDFLSRYDVCDVNILFSLTSTIHTTVLITLSLTTGLLP